MGSTFEEVENAIGNEAAAYCPDVGVPMPVLVATVQAYRLTQMQVLPGAGHRT
jgi:hypothetical protein